MASDQLLDKVGVRKWARTVSADASPTKEDGSWGWK